MRLFLLLHPLLPEQVKFLRSLPYRTARWDIAPFSQEQTPSTLIRRRYSFSWNIVELLCHVTLPRRSASSASEENFPSLRKEDNHQSRDKSFVDEVRLELNGENGGFIVHASSNRDKWRTLAPTPSPSRWDHGRSRAFAGFVTVIFLSLLSRGRLFLI